MSEAAVDPTRCPLCAEDNDCGAARGEERCWCFTATFSEALLDRVPPEAKGRACVCQRCAEKDPASSATE